MKKLPNGERALVDLAKLRDYCLNREHEEGKHKARVFRSALGLGHKDAEWLRDRLLWAAASSEVVLTKESEYGTLYVVDCALSTRSGSAVVRSGWIVRHDEDFPRLTTCFVRRSKAL